jgi:hypothetical protein
MELQPAKMAGNSNRRKSLRIFDIFVGVGVFMATRDKWILEAFGFEFKRFQIGSCAMTAPI